MAQPATLTPQPGNVRVKTNGINPVEDEGYKYDYKEPELEGLNSADKERVLSTFSTMYKTLASMFESLMDDMGVSESEARRLLPRGLSVRRSGAKFEAEPSQYNFEFKNTA